MFLNFERKIGRFDETFPSGLSKLPSKFLEEASAANDFTIEKNIWSYFFLDSK